MNVLYLIFIIIGSAGQGVVQKKYTQKTAGPGIYSFSGLVSLTAMLFFIVTSEKLNFCTAIVPYSIGFAASYALSTVFSIMAISCGSLALTSLFTSYSLMIPTFYGLVVLKDPVSAGLIPGIILLVVSLLLINYKSEKSRKSRISLRWIICVFVAFVGNGMCSTVQKMQQVTSGGSYKNEFMIIALAVVTMVMFLLAAAKEKEGIKLYVRTGWYLAVICGALNGMVNLFVMILSGRIPVSLMFPMISAGGIVTTYLVSRFYYKETLTRRQFAGFLIGIVSVVCLNI